MHEVIRTSRDATDAPLHRDLPTLRSVGIPTEPLRITPKSVPQQSRLTATPAEWPTDADVDRALGAYGDRIGQPAAWAAFGDDLPRGAA